MPRKPVLAYAVGGAAAAVAAVVITASTVGLTPSNSEGARGDTATAPAVLPAGGGTVLTSYADDEGYEHEYEHKQHGEREHDGDD